MAGFHAMMTLEPHYRKEQLVQYFMQLSPAQMATILPMVELMQREADSVETDDGSKSLAMAKMIELLITLFRMYSLQSVRGKPDDHAYGRGGKLPGKQYRPKHLCPGTHRDHEHVGKHSQPPFSQCHRLQPHRVPYPAEDRKGVQTDTIFPDDHG